jgi:hypothetical protein
MHTIEFTDGGNTAFLQLREAIRFFEDDHCKEVSEDWARKSAELYSFMAKSARNKPEIHIFVVRSGGEVNVRASYLLPLELA